MGNYYLAVDIGASSGRHMLASMEDGKMKLEEVYRFPNGMDNKNGTLCWDVDRLFTEIAKNLARFRQQWELILGELTMCFLMRRIRSSEIQ